MLVASLQVRGVRQARVVATQSLQRRARRGFGKTVIWRIYGISATGNEKKEKKNTGEEADITP